MKRYDSAPLFARLATSSHSQRSFATAMGVHYTTVSSWRHRGVGEAHVDAACGVLGVHPCELWPEYLEDEIERIEAERRARKAAKKRRDRANNPAYAERQRAYARRYKAENSDYVKAQYRRYYEANRERIVDRVRRRRQEAKAS